MHYCIGDVHGCLSELLILIEKIQKADSSAVIYLMGDIIDQGVRATETLLWAMENVTLDGPIRCLRGNHEEEVLLWYRKYLDWQNSEERTPEPPESKYDFYERLKNDIPVDDELLDRIADFFHTLPYSAEFSVPAAKDTGKKEVTYYLSHAWYSVSEDADTERQRWINLYGRSCDGISDFELKKYEESHPDEIPVVVCGHTPTISAVFVSSKADITGVNRPGLIGYRPHAIFTDGGCFHYGKILDYPCMLCAICLETLEEIYPVSLRKRMTDYNIITMRKTLKTKDGKDFSAPTTADLKRYYDEYMTKWIKDSELNPYRLEILSFPASLQAV